MKVYKTSISKNLVLTEERKRHFLTKHPEIRRYLSKIRSTLLKPDHIRIDKADPKVLLFYRYFATIGKGKYLTVIFKTNQRNFILTIYLTYRVQTGENYEQKD